MTQTIRTIASAMAATAVMALAACSSHRNAATAPENSEPQTQSVDPDAPGYVLPDPHTIGLRPVGRPDGPALAGPDPTMAAMPSAVAYRMSGEYADNVAITLSPDGRRIVSYPDPTDLTDASTPVPIGDGWYLSRCGISAGSVFTRYTYAAYRALEAPPSPETLMDSVIPGARVVAIQVLPLTPAQALDSLRRSPEGVLRKLRINN